MSADLASIRRQRAGRALSGAGLDALIVGQPRNLVYLTGARRVLVRGSRPFAPLAVLLAGEGDVWMQSFSTGDVPATLGRHLYAQEWNPQRLVEQVRRILGSFGATRIGVDSMTPAWRARLGAVLPSAELVPADTILRRLRTHKAAEELAPLGRAVAAAGAAIADTTAAVAAGTTEARVRARLASAVMTAGASLPHEGVCAVLEETSPLRRLPRDRLIQPGDRVAVDVSAVVDGYEAGVGRTVTVGATSPVGEVAPGGDDPAAPWRDLRSHLVAACRAGGRGADLLAAAHGWEREPALPLAYGYGFGPEAPLAPGDELAAGAVIAVQARIWGHGAGPAGWFGRDMVIVDADGGMLLTGEIPL